MNSCYESWWFCVTWNSEWWLFNCWSLPLWIIVLWFCFFYNVDRRKYWIFFDLKCLWTEFDLAAVMPSPWVLSLRINQVLIYHRIEGLIHQPSLYFKGLIVKANNFWLLYERDGSSLVFFFFFLHCDSFLVI